MKTQQSKSLFFFCLLSTIFFIPANAQIVYTDVNPDQLITCPEIWWIDKYNCSDSFNLDLNNDAIMDYKIKFLYSCSSGFKRSSAFEYKIIINPFNKNTVASDGLYPLAMNKGDTISSSLTNLNASSTIYDLSLNCGYWGCVGDTSGDWKAGTMRFLGLKLILQGKRYSGWARLNIGGNYPTVYDYAYNNVPDQPILAGDSGSIATNIHHIKSFSSLAISPNSFQHLTRISFSLPQPEKATVIIYNVTGRVIKILADEIMSAGAHVLTWDTHDESGNAVSTGIYFLKLQSTSFSQTEKLMVAK